MPGTDFFRGNRLIEKLGGDRPSASSLWSLTHFLDRAY